MSCTGGFFPIKMRAILEANRPRVWSAASTTYHLRAISPLWGNRLTSELSQKLKQLMKTAECHQALNAQRYQAGNHRTSRSFKDSLDSEPLSMNCRGYSRKPGFRPHRKLIRRPAPRSDLSALRGRLGTAPPAWPRKWRSPWSSESSPPSRPLSGLGSCGRFPPALTGL